jgi:hypothetical protein
MKKICSLLVSIIAILSLTNVPGFAATKWNANPSGRE